MEEEIEKEETAEQPKSKTESIVIVATIFTVLGWIAIAAAVLHLLTNEVRDNIAVILMAVYIAGGGLMMFAISEVLKVLHKIEKNTRKDS
jgi:cytochrome c biogenesis protein CcdA